MARRSTTMRFSAPSRLRQLLRPMRSSIAAWLTVLTVLFSAVAPAGLPYSTALGSAFNPATTSVALDARGPNRHFVVQRRANPKAGDLRLAWIAPRPAILLSIAVARETTPRDRAPDLATLNARSLERLRRAREPPSA